MSGSAVESIIGSAQEAPDSTAIPLCTTHHRTADDCYHKLGPRKFAEVHKLNIPGIVAGLNARPVIRVVSGTFVVSFQQERYVLGSTQAGLSRAVQKMIELRRTIQIAAAQNLD